MQGLTGSQQAQLSEALQAAFPEVDDLKLMLQFKLNIRLAKITSPLKRYDHIVFELIVDAEAKGYTSDLIRAAREANPGNPKLLTFAQTIGAAIGIVDHERHVVDPSTLERIIRQSNLFLDLDTWRSRLGEIEGQICRVEIATTQGQIYGTGFLVAPDVVMTNYHVIEAVHRGKRGTPTSLGPTAQVNDVTFRFDYKVLNNSRDVHPGTCYSLTVDDWLIDWSPVSVADLQRTGLPQPDELDYALLRVDGRPGDEPIGGRTNAKAPPRGWIQLHDPACAFEPGSPLFIVQHPSGGPLKLALDTDAVIALNENKTRVTYRTNTEPGSSGSPCFNQDWTLIALHHIGDPSFISTYNQGIPIDTIVQLLKQRNLELTR
jgi:V8-like Glu-specific endopeptidase